MRYSVKTLRGRNLGKYLIIFMGVILGLLANYNMLPKMVRHNPQPGVVVAKNTSMTTGRYPRQEFLIAFKFNDSRYGTQDKTLSFSQWSEISVGDRATFEADTPPPTALDILMIIVMLTFDVSVGVLLGVYIVHLLILLWRY